MRWHARHMHEIYRSYVVHFQRILSIYFFTHTLKHKHAHTYCSSLAWWLRWHNRDLVWFAKTSKLSNSFHLFFVQLPDFFAIQLILLLVFFRESTFWARSRSNFRWLCVCVCVQLKLRRSRQCDEHESVWKYVSSSKTIWIEISPSTNTSRTQTKLKIIRKLMDER